MSKISPPHDFISSAPLGRSDVDPTLLRAFLWKFASILVAFGCTLFAFLYWPCALQDIIFGCISWGGVLLWTCAPLHRYWDRCSPPGLYDLSSLNIKKKVSPPTSDTQRLFNDILIAVVSRSIYTFQSDFRPTYDSAIVQSLNAERCLIHAGFRLTAANTYIRPLYQQFLTKIQHGKMTLPITILVSHDRSRSNPGKGLSSSLNPEYYVLLTKNFPFDTKSRILNSLKAFETHMATLEGMLAKFFPFYGFTPLNYHEILQILQGPTNQPPPQRITSKHDFNLTHLIAFCLFLPIFLNCIIIPLSFFSFNSVYASIVFGLTLGLCVFLGSSFWLKRTALTRFFDSPFRFFDLFPKDALLIHPLTQRVVFNNFERRCVTHRFLYSLDGLNRPASFDADGFYRTFYSALYQDADYQFSQSGITVSYTISYRLRRVIASQFWGYSHRLSTEFWQWWRSSEREKNYLDYYRELVAGNGPIATTTLITFYIQAPLIGDGEDANSISKILDVQNILQETIKSAFTMSHFYTPHLPAFHASLVQNYHLNHVFSPLKVQLMTPRILAPYIMIPDVVMHALPLFYPARFKRPILHDELSLGRSWNNENCHCEGVGGQSIAELAHTVIWAGDDVDRLDAAQWCLFKQYFSWVQLKYPFVFSSGLTNNTIYQSLRAGIFFDWEGSWQKLKEYPLGADSSDHTYVFGTVKTVFENFGLDLFNLPCSCLPMEKSRYIRQVMAILVSVFQWGENQRNLLQSAWESIPHTQGVTAARLKVCIGQVGEVPRNTLQQQTAFTFLNYLDQTTQIQGLGTFMTNFTDVSEFFDPSSLLVINLEHFPTSQWKTMFIHVLLLQLEFLWAHSDRWRNHTLVTGTYQRFVAPWVYLPHVEAIFPAVVKSHGLPSITDICPRLRAAHWWFAFGTTHVAQMDGILLNEIGSFHFFKTVHPDNVTLIGQVAHLSSAFAMPSTLRLPQNSLQLQFFGSLAQNHSLVYRRMHRFPFIFQMDSLQQILEHRFRYTGGQLFLPSSRLPLLPAERNFLPLTPVVSLDASETDRIDIFLGSLVPELYPCYFQFFTQLQQFGTLYPDFSMTHLRTLFTAVFEPVFRSFTAIESKAAIPAIQLNAAHLNNRALDWESFLDGHLRLCVSCELLFRTPSMGRFSAPPEPSTLKKDEVSSFRLDDRFRLSPTISCFFQRYDLFQSHSAPGFAKMEEPSFADLADFTEEV